MNTIQEVGLTEEQTEGLRKAHSEAETSGGGIKTLSQLKGDWGLERFVPAFGLVTGFVLANRHPHSIDQMMGLLGQSQDAFTVYLCLMMHGANS